MDKYKIDKVPLFFSIIVPIFNVEKYLVQCVDSLISQTFLNYEIILVNDGSTDGCFLICEDFSKKHSKIKVINKPNGGLVSARQAGAQIASGKYILNVDGDDWVEPTYLEKIYAIAKKYSSDIICFGAKHIGNNFEQLKSNNLPSGLYDRNKIINDIFPILIEDKKGIYFSPSIWSKAIKRDIYLDCQNSVDQRINIGEDHAVTKPAIFKSNSLYIMDDYLYCYRLNPLSMTNSKRPFPWFGPYLLAKTFESQIDGYNFQEQIYRNVVHNLFNVVLSQFRRKERFIDIKQDILFHLSNDYYQEAIHQSHYNSFKHVLSKNLLKYNLVFLIYIIARTKEKSKSFISKVKIRF